MITCPTCQTTEVQVHAQHYWSTPWVWCLRCEKATDLTTNR